MNLSKETQAMIDQRLQASEFASADALVRAAFEAMDNQKTSLDEKRARLNAQLQIGIDAADAGEVYEGAVALRMQKDFLASLNQGK